MTSHTPIALGSGKFCYSGPNCRIHGKKNSFDSLTDVFNRVDTEFSAITERSGTTTVQFEKEAKAFFKTLSPNEKYAIAKYSDKNGSIRVNRTLDQNAKIHDPEVIRMVADLDSSFQKQQDGAQRTLYRGVENLPLSWAKDLRKGSTVTSLSYMSTSLNPHKAFEFTSREKPILFKIDSGRGLPILVHENEFEMLLPRKQSYQVVSVEENITVKAYSPNHDVGINTSQLKTKHGVTLITLRAK